MGLTAEAVAKEYQVNREDQDQFSYQSHMKALHAISEGYFKSGILPVKVEEVYLDKSGKKQKREFIVDTDEGPRNDTSPEALAKLKPVFAMGGTVTAGNSSQTSDGAAFVIVMGENMVNQTGIKTHRPSGELCQCGRASAHYGYRSGGSRSQGSETGRYELSQIDLVELNEAFASQALAVIRKLDMNPDIVNMNGGAIALGHPLGCTGAKLTIQITQDMKRLNKKYGLVTACVGGGQGIAGIIRKY